jgi:asparaginyl-tRNA synthetase
VYEPAAKSQLKKIQKLWVREQHKSNDKAKKEGDDAEKRAKNLEDAKKIVIEEDSSLPKAKKIKISEGESHRGTRVKIYGWVHRLRRQGIHPEKYNNKIWSFLCFNHQHLTKCYNEQCFLLQARR